MINRIESFAIVIEGTIKVFLTAKRGRYQTMKNKNSINCTKPWLESKLRIRKEMFYLTTQSTHFIYGYMASDIW